MYAPRDSPPRGAGRATTSMHTRAFIYVCCVSGGRGVETARPHPQNPPPPPNPLHPIHPPHPLHRDVLLMLMVVEHRKMSWLSCVLFLNRFHRDMTSQPNRKRQRTEPARHMHRLGDDELIECLSFAMATTGDYSVACRVSRRFRRLAAMPDAVEHLRVRSDRLTDVDCAALVQSSTGWTEVNLSQSNQLTNAGLAALAHLTSLTSLDLVQCTQITDAGVAALAPLTSLTSLDLGECNQLTDAVMTALAPLTSLVVHR